MQNSCISSSDIGNPCQSMSLFGSVFVEGHEAKVVCPIKTSSVLYGEGTREVVWSLSERILCQNSHPTLPQCDGINMYQWWCICFFLHVFCPVFFVSETIRCRFWASRGIRCQTAHEAELPRKHCSAPGEVIHLASIWKISAKFSPKSCEQLWSKQKNWKKNVWKNSRNRNQKVFDKLVRKIPSRVHTGVDIRHLARDDGQAPRPCQVKTSSRRCVKINADRCCKHVLFLYKLFFRWPKFINIRCVNDIIWYLRMLDFRKSSCSMKLQWDRWGLDKAMMAKQFSSMLHVATASGIQTKLGQQKSGENTKTHKKQLMFSDIACILCILFVFCFVRPHHCSQLHKSIPELQDLGKSVSGSRTVASVRTAWIHRNPLEFLESSRGFTLRFHTDLGCGGLHISCTTWSIKILSKNKKHVFSLHVSCTCWDGIWFTASVVAHGWLPIQWTPQGTQNHVSQFGTCFHGFQTFFQARRAWKVSAVT